MSTHDIDELVKQLPNELQPKRDLWSGIEQAVAKTPQQTAHDVSYPWGKIAAAVLPVAFMAGLYFQQPSSSTNEMQWLTPVTASYELQKSQLLKQVSGQPLVNENWQKSLKELEEAERALKEALRNQPEDPALMRMLNNVYQQQLEIISKSHKPKYMQI